MPPRGGRIFYSDTWISLASGRFIAAHGLPHVDTLSVAGHGRPWIDQQWLAHIAFYELWQAGGDAAVGAASAVAFAAAFGLLAALLVRRGAAPLAAAAALGAALVQCLLFAETRAQSFAYPLFVVLLWILLGEPGPPSRRRTWLVLPVLVVWADVHGSVLLGVAVCLTCLGLRAWGGSRRRAWRSVAADAALSALAAATLFATPYGTAMPTYYVRVLGDPALKTIAEWQPASFAPLQLPFILLLLGTLGIAAFARGRGQRIPADVLVVGILLGALATHAVRYQTWFALGVAPLLAYALTRVRPGGGRARPPRPILIAGACLLVAGVALSAAILVAAPERTFDRFVSQPAAPSVGGVRHRSPRRAHPRRRRHRLGAPVDVPGARRPSRVRRPHRDLPAVGLPALRPVPHRDRPRLDRRSSRLPGGGRHLLASPQPVRGASPARRLARGLGRGRRSQQYAT